MLNVVVIFNHGKVSKFTVKEVLNWDSEEVKKLLPAFLQHWKETKPEKVKFFKTPSNEVVQLNLEDVSMFQISES